ncbi:MAG: clostripain-related cysteine peptidase [Bacteroidaceae bacterium]
MKQSHLFFLLILICSISLTACKDDNKGDNPNPNEPKYRRTILIYIAARNSLGAYGASKADSSEIAYGIQYMQSTKDNVVLFLEDAKKPRLYRFYKSTNGKSYYELLKSYDDSVSSTNPTTLLDVLTVIKTKCPSKSYGLVLWSHGTCWLPNITSFYSNNTTSKSFRSTEAFGVDTGENGDMANDRTATGQIGPQMEIDDLANAIIQSGVHPDFIFFDACTMQSIEVAYALRHATDYIVASPATTSGYGCVYQDQIRKGFFAYPASDDSISKMVDTYYYDVMDNPETKNYYTNQGCIFSVIKTSELEDLAAATSKIITKAISNKNSVDLTGFNGYIDFETTGYPNFYDMSSVMNKILPEADYMSWKTILDKCVIYKKASDSFYYAEKGSRIILSQVDQNTYCGVSMFVPQSKYTQAPAFLNFNEAFKQTQWYAAAGWAQTGW